MTEDFYCEQVLSGMTQVDVVFESGDVLAFHHTRPSWPVHIVVIPKQHISSLLDLTDRDHEIVLAMQTVLREVCSEVVERDGACRVITNLGAYQDSKHLHWHVVSGEKLDVDGE